MKPKTKQILRALLQEHSPRILTGLWDDIRQLDEAAFQAALHDLSPATSKPAKKAAPKKPRAKKTKSLPANDAPATRVAHHLRTKFELDDPTAINLLSEALTSSGIRQPIPPATSGESLEQWLGRLFSVVSDAKVFATAKKLKKPS
ncbi:MAG: hypothetical protein KDI55_20305 [Anaerolineae bacterium]|nr:hypothetical protein [Anaerolineae bacterium]